MSERDTSLTALDSSDPAARAAFLDRGPGGHRPPGRREWASDAGTNFGATAWSAKRIA